MKTFLQLFALLFALAWLAACGAPGAPLPPSLELSRPVEDLTATRKGNHVFLTWSAPTQTTEGQNIRPRKIGPAQVCRTIAVFPMTSCAQVAGEIPASQVPVGRPGERPQKLAFTDTLSGQIETGHPTQFATYTVAMLNSRGRNAGLSNQVRVPLAPVMAPPSEVKANVTADAIVITWSSAQAFENPALSYAYRIYRSAEPAAAPVLIGEVKMQGAPQPEFFDRAFEWEKTYDYHVTPITIITEGGQTTTSVEGDDSPEIKVFAHDIFPPAQPTGLQAVYSGVGQKPFIDLTWAPNTEPDLAGYDVYRHEQGQPPVKINPALVKTPSYRDDNVQPGHTYFYSVTAIDLRENRSPRSQETSERVP